MLQEERNKYCTLADYYVYTTHEHSSEQQGSVTSAQENCSESSVDGERKEAVSEVVDVQLTRKDSHHFLASVIPSTSSIEDSSQLNKVHDTSMHVYTSYTCVRDIYMYMIFTTVIAMHHHSCTFL